MLKLYFVSLFNCVIFPFFSAGQILDTDKLKGQVRYVLEESYEGFLRDSIVQKSGKNRQYSWHFDNKMEFDKDAKLISRSFYDDDRIPLYTEYFEYKDKRIIRKDLQGFIYKYKYNTLGLIYEETVSSKTDTTDEKLRQRFRHDANGLLIDIWEFDMQGAHVRHQQNFYDEKMQRVKEIIKYKDGTEYKIYSYNIGGLLEKLEWYDSETGLMERTTFYYKSGKLSKETLEEYEGGILDSRIEYQYDQYENPIYILETNAKRQIREEEKISYVYDIGFNWVKRTTVVNNALFFIVERHVGYYL